jgi:hypothetical protein
MNGTFAIMWDCTGLEVVERMPDPAETTFALLKGAEPPAPPNLNHWRLRAMFNPQRHYEIYIISADAGIETEDIRNMFENSPQTAADTIRNIGNKFYSNRAQDARVVIR